MVLVTSSILFPPLFLLLWIPRWMLVISFYLIVQVVAAPFPATQPIATSVHATYPTLVNSPSPTPTTTPSSISYYPKLETPSTSSSDALALHISAIPVVVDTATVTVTRVAENPIVDSPVKNIATTTITSTEIAVVHLVFETQIATATATQVVKIVTETDTRTNTETETEVLRIVTDVLTQTQTDTVIVPPAATSTLSTSNPTYWSMPAQITDLVSDFGITSFPGPKRNIEVVDAIPESASASPTTMESQVLSSTSTSVSGSLSDPLQSQPTQGSEPGPEHHSILQLFYPEGSINPGGSPKGGSQFYATPLDLSNATSVSLNYSVFFPDDFDFVLGGKLPGLYGGHTGCSGGNSAEDCFSTRMMFREEGAGELYLYAPKHSQAPELCQDPQSDCNADYGYSLGRGSFFYKRGQWTNINQTVTLNTPGLQDGKFLLLVNGEKVLEKTNIFYRNAPGVAKGSNGDSEGGNSGDESGDDTSNDNGGSLPESKARPKPSSSHVSDPHDSPAAGSEEGLGGLLGGILGGGLLGGVSQTRRKDHSFGLRAVREQTQQVWSASTEDPPGENATVAEAEQVEELSEMQKVQALHDLLGEEELAQEEGVLISQSLSSYQSNVQKDDSDGDEDPVGFAGIFFSTFFGGHDPQYATPKDQYVWFKDFQLEIHG